MAKINSLIIAIAMMLVFGSAGAEILKVPGNTPQVATGSDVPSRGMSKTQVQRRYGAPANKRGAVGRPPISRWDYAGYSVYFEHHLVLHSVLRKQ